MDMRTLKITTAASPSNPFFARARAHAEDACVTAATRAHRYSVRGLEMSSDDAWIYAPDADTSDETLIEGITAPTLLGERRFDYLAGPVIDERPVPDPSIDNGYTLGAWVRRGSGELRTRFEDLRAAPSRDDLMLIVGEETDHRPVVRASIGGHYVCAAVEQPLPRDRWSHVAVTFESRAGLKVHVDGELALTVSLGRAWRTWQPFDRECWDLRGQVDGEVGELWIEDACLTPSAIRTRIRRGFYPSARAYEAPVAA